MITFGTDGWRAVIAKEFTFANIRIVAQAISDFLKKQKTRSAKIVVGYDCRFMSKQFARETGCVFAANGIQVTLSHAAVPTPAVSFHTRYHKYTLGIMITASHNPAEFNGLKIKTKDGGAADKSLTNKVEALLYKTKPKYITPEAARSKGLLREADLGVSYVRFLRKFVDISKIKKLRLNVLMDIMYGSAGSFAKEVLSGSGITIDYLRNDYNPSFGGIHPEPVEKNLTPLIRGVKKGNYDMGIALDGDADRIAAVTSKGSFIDAQVLLPLLSIHMLRNRREKAGIGKTLVGSNLVDKVALSLGVPCYETPVGFKYISALFKENLISIGGEEAGGIGFKGYIPERDGTMSFLMLLEMLAAEKMNFDGLLARLWKRYGHWYYFRTSLPLKKKAGRLSSLRIPKTLLGKAVEEINKADGIKLMTKDSWLMFRESGTEPIIRVYAEARSRKEVATLISYGERLIRSL